MRRVALFLVLLNTAWPHAQELNCTVSVNSDFINQTNQQIFRTLERSLNDFINKKQWTNLKYASHERINCSMVINVNQYDADQFSTDLQIQATRPVFNSSYQTPILNYQDTNFSFRYVEYEPLVYNPNNFESNLVSVITFYIYVILGMDADSFTLHGGDTYYAQAQSIANNAQPSGFLGWNQADGLRTRFWLIDNLRNNTFEEYRTIMYQYHREGLDIMFEDNKSAKQNIANTLLLFEPMYNRRPNNFLTQIFFDAKSDEVTSIFSDGPSVPITSLVNTLNRVSPFFGTKWQNIKY